MPGYCTECHRVKQVRVSGHGLAMAGARHGVVEGVCDDCETKDDARRWLRAMHGAREILEVLADARTELSPEEIPSRLDRQRVPGVLRALSQKRLVLARRGRDPLYTITPLGREVLRR
jgi:hypothetical protein